jgi:hypothetical protein
VPHPHRDRGAAQHRRSRRDDGEDHPVFRDITGYDRSAVRFDRDWNRDVVGEERSLAATGRFLDLRCRRTRFLAVVSPYQRAGTRLIPDARCRTFRWSGGARDGDGDPGPLDLSDSGLRSTSAEHAAHLNQPGVRASLTMAIEVAGHLWGMVTAHHYQPRRLSALRRAACRLLATSIAAPLAALEESADSSAHTRRALEISRAASEALERPGSSETALVHFAQSLAGIAEATGVLVRAGTATASAGTLPARPVLDRIAALAATESGRRHIRDRLSAADPSLAGVRDIASGAVGLDLPVPGGGILPCCCAARSPRRWSGRAMPLPLFRLRPRLGVAVHSREAGGSVPVPDDAPRVERAARRAAGRSGCCRCCRSPARRCSTSAGWAPSGDPGGDPGAARANCAPSTTASTRASRWPTARGRVVSCNQQFRDPGRLSPTALSGGGWTT